MINILKFCYKCYQPIAFCICEYTDSGYPPERDPLTSHSRCLFFQDRSCIELITLDENKPCESCIIYDIWWKEKKKELQARWLREGIEMMEELRSGERII